MGDASPETRSDSAVPAHEIPILMPEAGNTMESGAVLEWRVREGDWVDVGQILCEIETDKAVIEYESPTAGHLLRIVAAAGTVVPVKQPIAYLECKARRRGVCRPTLKSPTPKLCRNDLRNNRPALPRRHMPNMPTIGGVAHEHSRSRIAFGPAPRSRAESLIWNQLDAGRDPMAE